MGGSLAGQESNRADLEGLDLTDVGLFRDGPPHGLFARLRAERPVCWNATGEGDGFWSVTREADIVAVSRDPATFSSHRRGVFLQEDQLLPLDIARRLLLYMDPPEHTRFRQILQTAFTPRAVEAYRPMVQARVDEVIDSVAGRGRCDFVSDIAVALPLRVLADLMGIPDRDVPQLYEWTERMERAQASSEPNEAMATYAEMGPYLMEQIAAQRENDAPTIVTRLREGFADGGELDDVEILTFFGLLVFAGNDTTRNTAATGMLALLQHPEQLAQLQADPTLVADAVEEILRHTSVVNWFARTATRDVELGGQQIREGERVVLWYLSGSRDEDLHEDADALDVRRCPRRHLAFGGGGRHFCLGAGLARLELQLLFEAVVTRLRDVRLDGTPTRLDSTWAHGLRHLPIRFEPGGATKHG